MKTQKAYDVRLLGLGEITVAADTPDELPRVGDRFTVTLFGAEEELEIVKVTARRVSSAQEESYYYEGRLTCEWVG